MVERGSKSSRRAHSSRLKPQSARNDHLESSGKLGRHRTPGPGVELISGRFDVNASRYKKFSNGGIDSKSMRETGQGEALGGFGNVDLVGSITPTHLWTILTDLGSRV